MRFQLQECDLCWCVCDRVELDDTSPPLSSTPSPPPCTTRVSFLADDLPSAPTELVNSFGFDKGEKFGFGGDFADNASLKSDTASIRGDKAGARTQSGGPLSRRVLFHKPIVLVEASFMHLVLFVGCCHCHEHVLCDPMKFVHFVGPY